MSAFRKIWRMPPRELTYRLAEKARVEMERYRISVPLPVAPGNFKNYLRGAAGRFYRLPSRELFVKRFPRWVVRAVKEADALCRHEVNILNFEPVRLGPEIDWHKDPITGQAWGRLFWADYKPETDHGGRDSKRVHELNRHQHLPRLAKAYFLTGEERYAAEAIAQMETWIEQNPPGMGINWQSSLEIALRAISWMWTIFLLADSASLNAAAAQRIGDSLFAQLERVHRYDSRFSSPNTHLLGEATALFIGGLTFRDLKRPTAWLRHAEAVLVEQATAQILDDGVHAELSSYYHCYTLDFYLQVFVLARQNDFGFPPVVKNRVIAMLRFLASLTRQDGTIPLLGDDDGGRALALQRTTYTSYTDGLGLGAALFGEAFGGELTEEVVWLFGAGGNDDDPRILKPALPSTQVFESAGYAIHQSDRGHLVFDFGGLGMLTGGHAHADALSVTLFSGGRDLLVDPGTFVYNSAPEWREYFRSTRAHNTVAIDGRNQAEMAGTFRWRVPWRSRLRCHYENERGEYFEAEHDGYRDGLGIVHRRRLFHAGAEYWVIADDFRGSGSHDFDFSFHLGLSIEDFRVEERKTGFLGSEDPGFFLGLHSSGPVITELCNGWISGGYGEKRPAKAIHARLAADTPAGAITIVVPAQTGATLQPIDVEDAIACSYRSGPVEDIVVFSLASAPIEIEHLRMEGEFFWLRLRDGELHEVAAVQARSLTVGDRNIFSQPSPEPYFSLKEEIVCAPFAAF